MIEGIQVRFERRRIVQARATRGQEVLERLMGTDEGARHWARLDSCRIPLLSLTAD